MAKKVTLYTDDKEPSLSTRRCPTKKEVAFEEINVTKRKPGAPVVIKVSRSPFLVVKGSSSVNTVSGFSEFSYASAPDPCLSYEDFLKAKKGMSQMRLKVDTSP